MSFRSFPRAFADDADDTGENEGGRRPLGRRAALIAAVVTLAVLALIPSLPGNESQPVRADQSATGSTLVMERIAATAEIARGDSQERLETTVDTTTTTAPPTTVAPTTVPPTTAPPTTVPPTTVPPTTVPPTTVPPTTVPPTTVPPTTVPPTTVPPTTVPPTTVPPTTAPPATQPPASGSASGVWQQLAECESGGNWAINTGNGYYGGLQFSLQSWQAVGGTGYPHEASISTQIAMGERLQAAQGWGAWPHCSRELGLR